MITLSHVQVDEISANCHEFYTGRTADETEKLRNSTMPRKVQIILDECAYCPIVEECKRLGTMINLDGDRIFLDGIFGGMTKAERKAEWEAGQ